VAAKAAATRAELAAEEPPVLHAEPAGSAPAEAPPLLTLPASLQAWL
jgi:hypothetical protein